MTYEIEIGGRKASVSVRALPDGRWAVAIDDGPERAVAARAVGAAEWLLADEEGGLRQVAVHLDGDRLTAQVGGHGLAGTLEDPRTRALNANAEGSAGTLRSPMPGAVARVLVKVGDAVVKGQVLVVVEAMKMENEFKSPMDGVVSEVGVTAGTTIESNALLAVVIAPGGVA